MSTCTVCEKPFVPFNTLHVVCGYSCAAKIPVIARKKDRADTKRRKEAIKTRKELTSEAQHAFNRFIRLRDAGKPCICCGAPMNWNSTRPGGEIDAGHYLSIGSAPHMRFVEGNVHAQAKHCNRPGGAQSASFRAGIEARIGRPAVEVLEADQTPRKFTADDLRAIRDDYRARVKSIVVKRDLW